MYAVLTSWTAFSHFWSLPTVTLLTLAWFAVLWSYFLSQWQFAVPLNSNLYIQNKLLKNVFQIFLSEKSLIPSVKWNKASVQPSMSDFLKLPMSARTNQESAINVFKRMRSCRHWITWLCTTHSTLKHAADGQWDGDHQRLVRSRLTDLDSQNRSETTGA